MMKHTDPLTSEFLLLMALSMEADTGCQKLFTKTIGRYHLDRIRNTVNHLNTDWLTEEAPELHPMNLWLEERKTPAVQGAKHTVGIGEKKVECLILRTL
ncbi:hypothetical protein SDC9_75944 [bioreactor metagenome]|uniref:Uncharacterized protein n=1 Tax=bioreactor metagenome TaxID=1076179 RepID=A0A644YTN3_9ZZZZ